MQRYIFCFLFLTCFFSQHLLAQSERVPGAAEKKLTDSLCASLAKIDMSSLKTAKEAKDAFMNSFMNQSSMFEEVANERNIAMDDKSAMHKLGMDIGKNLLNENCEAFRKLSLKMIEKSETEHKDEGVTSGTFKRIDLKGFNYIVIKDENNVEKSFIWYKQFPGSEAFMNQTNLLTGKRFNISWQEVEVYLPQAKGYYNIKEITKVEKL